MPARVFREATFLALLEPRPPPSGTPTGEGKAGAGMPPRLGKCRDRSAPAGGGTAGAVCPPLSTSARGHSFRDSARGHRFRDRLPGLLLGSALMRCRSHNPLIQGFVHQTLEPSSQTQIETHWSISLEAEA